MIINGNKGSSTLIIKGPAPTDAGFTLSSTRRDTVISAGGASTRTTNDLTFQDVTTATFDRVSDVSYQETVQGTFDAMPVFASSNTSVATVDQFGLVTRVSDGTVGITVAARLLKKNINVVCTRFVGTTTSTFVNYATGSAGRHCCDAVDNRISGKSAATAVPVYTRQDHANGIYVRNTGFWAADLDLTSFSPWNSSYAQLRAGTLISPRHIVMAAHFPYGAGTVVRFVKMDNTVVTRTVTNAAQVGTTDIWIAVLDSDVPSGISFAKVLPSSWKSYFYTIGLGANQSVPTLSLDQEEHGSVGAWYGVSSGGEFDTSIASSNTVFARNNFYETIIVGDSGNPAFLIINNQLVLLSCWHFATGGPHLGSQIAAVNAVMTSLGGGYQLTTVDLSGFPTYP